MSPNNVTTCVVFVVVFIFLVIVWSTVFLGSVMDNVLVSILVVAFRAHCV